MLQSSVDLVDHIFEGIFYMPNGNENWKVSELEQQDKSQINKNSPTFFLHNHLVRSRLSTEKNEVFLLH